MGKFKFAIGAGTLGMHYTLRNSLTIKVSKQVNQVEILKQERAILANSLGALGIRYLSMAIRSRAALRPDHGQKLTGQPLEVVYTGCSL